MPLSHRLRFFRSRARTPVFLFRTSAIGFFDGEDYLSGVVGIVPYGYPADNLFILMVMNREVSEVRFFFVVRARIIVGVCSVLVASGLFSVLKRSYRPTHYESTPLVCLSSLSETTPSPSEGVGSLITFSE
jgi:hypothetical protein